MKKTYIEPAIRVKAMAEEAAVMAASNNVKVNANEASAQSCDNAESKGSVWGWMED